MYTQTNEQRKAELALSKQGFRFGNWIAFTPDAENQPNEGTESLGVMVMVKQNRFGREYREIEPSGIIN